MQGKLRTKAYLCNMVILGAGFPLSLFCVFSLSPHTVEPMRLVPEVRPSNNRNDEVTRPSRGESSDRRTNCQWRFRRMRWLLKLEC
ncbi:hypothetical protein F4777DRAFT_536824 [Nemania sp. FL0916]|nr:hypothetical protein F4777DRAFT_536824 [Nemania sp. FL0916]